MRRKKGENINGWLVIDKPEGISSARVVAIVKRLTKAKKVGHAGTLDPLATGILPIVLGEATKTVNFAVDADKEYVFTVTFGASTSTDDSEGEILETSANLPEEKDIINILPEFKGEIEQIPPLYSAIKIDGKRSYALARKGEAKAIKSRKVTIHELKLLNMPSPKQAELQTRCSKGTYIRSIARDMGEKLGCLAHISKLRRTKVGIFSEKDAISLEYLEEIVHNARLFETLLPVEVALDDIPVLQIDSGSRDCLQHGQPLNIAALAQKQKTGTTMSATYEGKLIAIGRIEEGFLKPVRVFNH